MADLTGQQLGQYTIGEPIGHGGMAHVYRAHQASMDRDVAIKVMASDLTNNAEFVARFEREARVIARLQHPYILPVIDFGRSGDHVYLVMRLITGGVLSERMQRTPLTIQQAGRFLDQIASALQYAHRNGVIHRDLKPTNVLLDEQDNVYLTDFGIAKMLAGSTSQHSLTATGRVMGTPAYMAPEQWRSDPVDARTDIYALGVILYEMLLGALPFNSDTPYGMMYKHFDTPPPTPRAINPDLPDALEAVVLRALAKRPEDRYASAEQMADDFGVAMRTLPQEVLARPLPRASVEQIERATPPSQRQAEDPHAAPATAATVPPSSAHPGALAGAPSGPPAPPPPYATQGTTRAHPPRPQPARRRGGILILGLLAVLVVVGAFIITLAVTGGDADGNLTPDTGPGVVDLDNPTATHTQSAIVLLPDASATPDATLTPFDSAPIVATLTATPAASDTGLPTAVPSLTPEPSATPTHTPSATLTVAPTLTPVPSDTPDFDATTEALVADRLTQTAASWTDTPTPDIALTVVAAMTGTASAWTATPTPTASRTATNTLPPPPTSTQTRTPTPTPSATYTRTPTRTPSPTRTPTLVQCNNMPARLEPGEGARTTLFPDEVTRVRRYPGTNQTVERSIRPGVTFDVTGDPQCQNGILWWPIEGYDENGRWSGWIGEGQNGTYWVEPFETNGIACPGAPLPRLTPSETGRVKPVPPAPNRVRSSPEAPNNANVIGEIQAGQEFDVISGPVCDPDGRRWRWWLVQRGNLTGWTAEGEPGTYWLEPWP